VRQVEVDVRATILVVVVLAALFPWRDARTLPADTPRAPAVSPVDLQGVYRIRSRPDTLAVISLSQILQLDVAIFGDSSYRSVGYWNDTSYVGILARQDGSVPRDDSVGVAWLGFRRGTTGDLLVERWWPPRGHKVLRETWVRVPSASPGPTDSAQATTDDDLPRFGEYVYVEEIPEAIKKVAPEYPERGRQKWIEGTVMVQALVGRDGQVKETRVTQSLPYLDYYAVKAVKQWRFRPAMTKGRPVAVWVAIPMKFSLH
jgi:TonB family protein